MVASQVHVLTVVGARPQFVKAGVVCRALANAGVRETLVHTGQHFDDRMSEVFFRELEIPFPKFNLGINSAGHGAMTGRMLEKLEQIFIAERPDWCLVYGDTNSTVAAALAAAKLHVPVAHVEAGLRSWNRRMPEEINRILTDHLSTALFCSSSVGEENLRKEGITNGVHVTGDVMADASRIAKEIVSNNTEFYLRSLPSNIQNKEFALLTLHRAENTDCRARLTQLVHEINELDVPVVFPVHPRTSAALATYDLTFQSHVACIEPLGYLEMTAVIHAARAVLTDSGGLQKEAYWAQVPCITLREETEWLETIDSGWNRLANVGELRSQVSSLVTPGTATDAYGEGYSAELIVSVLAAANAEPFA